MYARNRGIVGLVAAMGIACMACSGSSGSEPKGLDGEPLPKSCSETTSKLQHCGLLTQGRIDREDTCAGYTQCVLECVQSRSCEELESELCEGSFVQATPLEMCTHDCRTMACDDGNDTYQPRDRCDGHEDCEDGSDESGCPTFQCDDGGTVVEARHCNGIANCEDGSDEAGCPMFQCDSGATVSESVRCDGDQDCSDGSDETGCPPQARLTCGA